MSDLYRHIVNTSNDFITLINRAYIYQFANTAYSVAFNREEEEIVGKSVQEIWGQERFDSEIKDRLDDCFAGKQVDFIERFVFGDTERYMHISMYPYPEGRGEVTHAMVFSHDITKLGEIEAKLINYEYRDPITGLFNRRSLDVILEMELEKAAGSEREKLRALLFIRLENLSKAMQTLGHGVGDILLENTGIRIHEALRKSDYVFRFDGPELTVILSNLAGHNELARICEEVSQTIATPYRFQETDIAISGRIGVAVYPTDGADKDTLIRNAISAMNEASRADIPYLLFDSPMHERAAHRIELEGQINRAFQESQFELYYQPIVNRDGSIRGAECLIRWNHPASGLVLPGEFIPVAEETGLITSIDRWVIYSACRKLAEWNLGSDFYLSVNLSAKEFADPELVEVVTGALKSAGNVESATLKLEITESASMIDPELTVSKMAALDKLGLEILIDDFGTGHSSLGYLRELPASTLKIDRVFVENMEIDDDERAYLTAIVNLIKSRNKKIIVEGVATRRQFEFLGWINCDMMQGFYLSRPIPEERFLNLLGAGRLPHPE